MNQVKIREDLDVSLVKEDDSQFIYISDPLLVAEPIALPFAYYTLIQALMEDDKTEEQLVSDGIAKTLNLSDEKLRTLLDNLRTLHILENPVTSMALDQMNSYLNGNVRNSYCHGFSYPEDPIELTSFLKVMLDKGKSVSATKPKAVLAPHIDLRLEESWEVYANSFLPLENIDEVDTVILLGTAHYASTADFMFTRKNYVTPLGTLETDQELIDKIEEKTEVHFDDIAHFKEHSIEFHTIFLQHLLKEKNIKILPVLTGSPSKFVAEQNLPDSDEKYMETLVALKDSAELLGRKTIILSSGDFSHVGRKFGDEYDAGKFISHVQEYDQDLAKTISANDKNQFFKAISSVGDKNRICGTAPFYAAMHLLGNEAKIRQTGYSHWYEQETESLVSFGGFVAE
ncbi:MAG: AmmeMemoRadiSam system protein B [Chlorobiota bacterium]